MAAMVTIEQQLEHIFLTFAGYGTRQYVADMDGARFVKLCKDAKLVDRAFTTTDVDIVFSKVKAKGSRRINFDQFINALEHISERKNVSTDYVVSLIVRAFPTTNATQADYVMWHDDKTTYTGVYAKGGPTTVDKLKAGCGGVLSNLCDRTPADVRGVKQVYTTVL